MRRSLLSLAAAFGILAFGLSSAPATANSCEECADHCSMIPMETGECLRLYCPECAGGSVGVVVGPRAG